MDKKKISKKIIIPAIILVLVIGITSIFLLNKNKKNTNNSSPSIETVNQNTDLENEIQTDVINQKISAEYNGNYKFKSIADISFAKEISRDSERLIYEYFTGAKDKASFRYYLDTNKAQNSKNEIITLVNGKYSKSINKKLTEQGLYFGNQNKSYVYTESNTGTIEINNKKHEIGFEISLNGYWIKNNLLTNSNIIYIREKFYYDNIEENFIYVTYIYEMV